MLSRRRVTLALSDALSGLMLNGCTAFLLLERPIKPPPQNLFELLGRHAFGNMTLTISPTGIVIEDPECGIVTGANRRVLQSPYHSYEYDIVAIDQAVGECQSVADNAVILRATARSLDQSTLTAYPYGNNFGYLLADRTAKFIAGGDTYAARSSDAQP